MFDEALRLLKERVYVPFVQLVAKTGVTPTQVTLLGFVAGLACAWSAQDMECWRRTSFLWWLGRILDGLDGSLARFTNQQTEFGGYVDILCDFCVYSLIPLGVVHSARHVSGEAGFYVLALLLGSYFVNAASLFMLSSLLEKRQSSGKKKAELTSVTMPRGLIEGLETMIMYQLFLLFPAYCVQLMTIFFLLVVTTILLRLIWAHKNLN
jgi:phosphatidylglycerophosphate synthase